MTDLRTRLLEALETLSSEIPAIKDRDKVMDPWQIDNLRDFYEAVSWDANQKTGQAMTDDLTRIGDQMQSEGSRMAEWVLDHEAFVSLIPHEAVRAAATFRYAAEEWTNARSENTSKEQEAG
jgi:hypothetical protein